MREPVSLQNSHSGSKYRTLWLVGLLVVEYCFIFCFCFCYRCCCCCWWENRSHSKIATAQAQNTSASHWSSGWSCCFSFCFCCCCHCCYCCWWENQSHSKIDTAQVQNISRWYSLLYSDMSVTSCTSTAESQFSFEIWNYIYVVLTIWSFLLYMHHIIGIDLSCVSIFWFPG